MGLVEEFPENILVEIKSFNSVITVENGLLNISYQLQQIKLESSGKWIKLMSFYLEIPWNF